MENKEWMIFISRIDGTTKASMTIPGEIKVAIEGNYRTPVDAIAALHEAAKKKRP